MLLQSLLRPVLTPIMTGVMAVMGVRRDWSPENYFSAGRQGAWYEMGDLSTVFQSDGTTPVTAAGQSVGKILDKSGRGNHLILTNCTYEVDALGLGYVAFDSASTAATAAAVDLSAADKVTVFAGFASAFAAASSAMVCIGSPLSQDGTFDFGMYSGGAAMFRRGVGVGALASGWTNPLGTNPVAVSIGVDFAGTTIQTEMPSINVNGGVSTVFNTFGSPDTGAGPLASEYVLKVGGGGIYGSFTGRIYSIIVAGGVLTAPERANGDAWTMSRAVSTLAYSLVPTTFTDTGGTIEKTGYLETSLLSRVVFTTTATQIDITAYSSIAASFYSYAEVGVIVNGSYVQSVQLPGNGAFQGRVVLSAGSKTVEVFAGLQIIPDGQIIGTWPVSIKANAAITQIFPTPSDRVVFYGDSITAGGNSSIPTQKGYPALVRLTNPDSVSVEAQGYRSLFADCANSTLRAEFVEKLTAYDPDKIWLAIGTNDYGLEPWSAASFGAAYAALLDDLHVALPSALIYAQTPILRAVETANGWGSSLGDYRTQIAAAQSTRSSYCTLVDGSAFMTLASIPDGVHPNDAGHALYAAAVKTALGWT